MNTGSNTGEHPITAWLRTKPTIWFTLYAAVCAFCLYICVFAFRKTYTVATFEGMVYWGVNYKVWLVVFQAVGYGLSKFIGIKVISELRTSRRKSGTLIMITIAAVSWFFFAIVPPPYNIVFLFTNGLPLGMVWGIVFAYLEGRKVTEVLGAALSISFIFSSGLCRSAGSYLMQDWSVPEKWMPFAACGLFLLPLLLFLWLLDKIPPPSPEDEVLRTKRGPMSGKERIHFTKTFLPGIILFVLAYMLLTTFRDFRDNFSAEVWKGLGFGNSPSIYTRTEVPVSLIVFVVVGLIMFIRKNDKALLVNHLIIAFGMLLIGIATYLFESRFIDAVQWMILIGLGLYLGYVPYNCVFFERLLATFRYPGTVGFVIYIADSFGYLGSIAVLFYREFAFTNVSWLDIFIASGYYFSIIGFLLITGSMIYFQTKYKRGVAYQES